MSIAVASPPAGFKPLRFVVTLLLCLGSSAPLQAEGARPIEFSEPRDPTGRSTNSENPATERRRLTDLEDRLSKTFDFLEFEDSLSGLPNTSPSPVRRVPNPARPAKPLNFWEQVEEWSLIDKSRQPEGWDTETGDRERSFGIGERGTKASREKNLLESLRSEDWLVRGSMSASFWEMPLIPRLDSPANNAPSGIPEGRDSLPLDRIQSAAVNPTRDLSAGWQSGPNITTGSRDRKEQAPDWSPPLGPGAVARRETEVNVDAYRNLLGMGSIPTRAPADLTSEVYRSIPGGMGVVPPPTAPSLGFEPGRLQGSSLQPLRPVDRALLAPIAPVAPSRPTVFDALQPETELEAASKPWGNVSRPFYEAPRRRF